MRHRSRRPVLEALAVAVAGSGAVAASAGPLVITPTTIAIAPDRGAAVVEVANAGDAPVDLQFRAYDWRQADGHELLTPSDGLIVSPPIATVAPHAKQLFRVLRVGTGDGGGGTGAGAGIEHSWRLRLDQLPRLDQPAVSVTLEFLLPVFQTPAGAAARLTWQARPGEVTVTNTGTARARIGALALVAPGAAPLSVPGATSIYLLSGTSRTFAVPASPIGVAGTRLVATIGAGTVDVALPALAAR